MSGARGDADRGRARLALLALTTVWGSTFVVLQTAIESVAPPVVVCVRFLLAGALLAALRPRALRPALAALRPTLGLSLSMLAGFWLQTAGLAWTTPARSAFLTSLSVLLVPGLEVLLERRLPRPRHAAAAALAGGGVLVLFWPIALEWTRGDTLTLLAAATFAYYVVELGRVARALEPLRVVLAQAIAIALLAGAGSLATGPRLEPRPGALLALAYLGVVATAVTFLLMTWAQARVDAVEAAVIYTLEPVLAAAFSIALGREALTGRVVAGGVAVVAATLLAATEPARRAQAAPQEAAPREA